MGETEASRFTSSLRFLSADDLHRIAASLEADALTDEVDWWRATIAIDKVLRRAHNTRQAARVAGDAVHAVQEAAERAGIELPDREVTSVARAAAELARGLVAGAPARPMVRLLAEHWAPVFAAH